MPTIDHLSNAPALPSANGLDANAAASRVTGKSSVAHEHRQLGVPSFFKGGRNDAHGAAVAAAHRTVPAEPVAAARAYLRVLGPVYGLDAAHADTIPAVYAQRLPSGASIVKFRNRIDGIEVFAEEAAVLLGVDRRLHAIGGFAMGGKGRHRFDHAAPNAVATALADWSFDAMIATTLHAVAIQDDYTSWELPAGMSGTDGSRLADPVRTKRVWYRMPDALLPAYYVEVAVRDGVSGEIDAYAYVVGADDLRILHRASQKSHAAFSYKVYAEAGGNNLPLPSPGGRNAFPHPTATNDGFQGPFVTQNTVTLQSLPFSRNDPWLPDNATTTSGNNVDAYVDRAGGPAVDECNTAIAPAGDFHACLTAPLTFAHTFDPTLEPVSSKSQMMGAVTNLFYVTNWYHDWYYDAGFDEVSGNAQFSNYGRGGLQDDSMRAEAQDSGGYNNANMATPADGANPRMQMYLWISGLNVAVTAPAGIAGSKTALWGRSGPAFFNVLGAVQAAAPPDACTALTNAGAVSGKLLLIQRTLACALSTQLANAQATDAIAIVVSGGSTPYDALPGDIVPSVSVPVVTINFADGRDLANNAGATLRLERLASPYRDGTVDNTIVAHEWMHYMTNRLVGNSNGLWTRQGGGMGEGWSDFNALLSLVKLEDALVPSNSGFQGTYAIAGHALGAPNFQSTDAARTQGNYFGIRRYPYSRDMAKNPLTFAHIADATPLPAVPPPISTRFNFGSNSRVHNIGEVWSSMLWECYSNLLVSSPATAQDRMKRYLVAGLKLTPVTPTLTEARDALLSAIAVESLQDHAQCYGGFAKRGLGINAWSPDRYSSTNAGFIEGFSVGGAMTVDSMTLSESPLSCDADGIVDGGEDGIVTLTLRNWGTNVLSNTYGVLSSNNARITFPDAPDSPLPPSNPGETFTFKKRIHVTPGPNIEDVDITIFIYDNNLQQVPVALTRIFRINQDFKANQSATDNVESPHTVWTTGAVPATALAWRRVQMSIDSHVWLGPDADQPALNYLMSPPLVVAPTGDFTFSLKHRFDFELDWDGGQVQISTDGGNVWTDIESKLSTPYTRQLQVSLTNPFSGKRAFNGRSVGYPAFNTLTANLGTQYAGQTVLIRFAIGSDESSGDTGWEIDDIAFNNITNKPFDLVVPHQTLCQAPLDVDGNGVVDPLTDGLLALRYMFGLRGANLIEGAVAPGAPRSTAAAIEAQLKLRVEGYDLDGNGVVDPLTDGLLVIRGLSGITGNALTQGLMAPNATRNGQQVSDYLGVLKTVP